MTISAEEFFMSNPVFLLLIALCITSTCAVQSHATTPEGGSMAGRHWALRKLSHETIRQTEPELATVRFRDDGQIDGTASCNGISASLTWSHDHANAQSGLLRNDGRPSIQTVVGCGDRWATTMANGFWKKMETAERWSRRGNRLRIAFAGGDAADLVSVAAPASRRKPDCGQRGSTNFDCANRR